jgi:quinol-cytochrome oxidoreductase complex cytochrome b subunit
VEQKKADKQEIVERIKRLIEANSLTGAILLLKSVDSQTSFEIMSSLPEADQNKLYDLWIAADEKPDVSIVKKKKKEAAEQKKKMRLEEKIKFFPDHFISEATAMIIVVCLISFLTIFFPAGLESKSSAYITPTAIKPEWYFLFLYALLHFVPELVGVLLPAVGIGGLFALPFLDKNPEIHPLKRKIAMTVFTVLVVGIVTLALIGYFE